MIVWISYRLAVTVQSGSVGGIARLCALAVLLAAGVCGVWAAAAAVALARRGRERFLLAPVRVARAWVRQVSRDHEGFYVLWHVKAFVI
jgi:hypothetical protein